MLLIISLIFDRALLASSKCRLRCLSVELISFILIWLFWLMIVTVSDRRVPKPCHCG